MVMVSPFANSVRATPVQAAARNQGLGSIAQLLQQMQSRVPQMPSLAIKEQFPLGDSAVEPTLTYDQAMGRNMQQDMKSPEEQARIDAAIARGPESTRGPDNTRLPVGGFLGRAAAPNPFEGNEQYQALMEYQQSLAPTQEQQTRLQELRSAFEGTGAFKDYRIQQMEQQMQQMQQRYRQPRSPMGMGLGMANPYGMQPFQNFGRPQQFPMQMPMPRGGYNQYNRVPMQQPNVMQNQYQQQYMNPYQQMRPQPQQFGGYGMGQQMGGYGSFGGMPNPYQPQQMGYNQNNYSGYSGMQNFASFG